MSITEADLDRWFTYHRPTPEQQSKYDVLTANIMSLARLIVARDTGLAMACDGLLACIRDLCPEGTERDLARDHLGAVRYAAADGGAECALMHLRSARMWANAAIACAPLGDETAR